MRTSSPTRRGKSPEIVADNLLARLPGAVATAVREASAVAEEMGIELYLVGGTVRDLILALEPRDLDLLVNEEGDALAAELAARWRSPVKVHETFLTAELVAASGLVVDVATMRSEEYETPGALPVVRPGTLAEDLARRDFTVNTLAIPLFRGAQARVIDDWGGMEDLAHRELRVLHDTSFIDDPTRALRGVRLVVDLGFSFHLETRDLLRSAVAGKAFDVVSGDRLWRELRLMWSNIDSAAASLRELEALGLLDVFLPSSADVPAALEALSELGAQTARPSLNALTKSAGIPWIVLSLLTSNLRKAARDRVAARLSLAGAARKRLAGGGDDIRCLAERLSDESLAPHEVYEALERRNEAAQVLLWLASGRRGRSRFEWYWNRGRKTRLEIRGADLIAHGIEAGPAIGQALKETLHARLDGQLEASMELEFALSRAGVSSTSGQGQANDS